MKYLKDYIRTIPDFPEEGILFRDITPLIGDERGLVLAVEEMEKFIAGYDFDKVVGPESRGFIFAPIIARDFCKGFVPVRKRGKLPYRTIGQQYNLDYGQQQVLEIHEDAIRPGERILIVDDLIATGGTTDAIIKLVEKAGGIVYGVDVLMELNYLHGREAIAPHRLWSAIQFDE